MGGILNARLTLHLVNARAGHLSHSPQPRGSAKTAYLWPRWSPGKGRQSKEACQWSQQRRGQSHPQNHSQGLGFSVLDRIIHFAI